jgi:phosphoesterase RecJ-like protein
VLFKQVAPELFRLSMRTTERVDATAIAVAFGGGGHRRAAGCDVRGALPEARQRVLRAYREARTASDG